MQSCSHTSYLAPSSELAETMRASLRSAAQGALSPRVTRELDARTRRLLRFLCDVAHRDGLRVEEVLVMLKDSWRRLPESHRLERMDGDFLLANIITQCIKEFYRG